MTPIPSAHQAEFASTLRDSFQDMGPTELNNQDQAGPGDVGWAFQWDFALPVGGSVLISKDKQITPEPSACVMIPVGSGLLLRMRKRMREQH